MVEEEAKGRIADFSLANDTYYNSIKRNKLTNITHAQSKPAHTAFMSNEMCCDIICHLIFPSKNMLFLAKRANDIRAPDRFLHIRTIWWMKGLTNFSQLYISVKKGLWVFLHEWDHQEDNQYNLVTTDCEYKEQSHNHFTYNNHHLMWSIKNTTIEYIQIFCKDLHDLTNRSHIEEYIDRG